MPDLKPPAFFVIFSIIALLVSIPAISFVKENYAAGFISFVLIILVIITVIFESKNLDSYYAKISAGREGLGICQFARSFDTREVDTWVIRGVYEYLYNHLGFSVKADDELFGFLKIKHDDLDFDLAEIAKRVGRSLENFENNPYYSGISSVRDLVNFFNTQPLVKPH